MPYSKPNDVRVLFIGTPEIAVPPLLALIEEGYQVVGLVCQEDKEVGRKRILTAPPTKVVALEHALPVFQPHRIRKDYAWAKDLDLDVIVTMAYGQILPDELLKLPKKGSINLHGSLLPKYRGAAPIQRAIEHGEKETGITLMEMVSEMDAGRMYAKSKVEILEDDTYSSLAEKLGESAAKLIKGNLMNYVNDKLIGEAQNEAEVTYADKIGIEEEKLDLSLNKIDLIHKIHSLSEEPGGYLSFQDKKFKIFHVADFDDLENEPIGTISLRQKKLLLSVRGGHIVLESVQLEGKKKMSGLDFASGAHLSGTERLIS